MLAAEFGDAFEVSEQGGEATSGSSQRFDVILLIGGGADKISDALLDYLAVAAVTLVAPVTARYCKNLPLYLISIPKAGTHLLFRLAEALGYATGGVAPEQPKGGHWYYLLHSNAHTTARDFFRDELQRAPFGNRAHPFMRSPALFNYRNPRDILVSEANYWHVDGNSPLSVLLGQLSFEQRVARLIDDRWLLGSIRDRVGEFAAWLDCTNVIPVSFEEMVGDAGGGSDTAFDALVWSLQLKLHVPGITEDIRSAASGRSSPTFREGRINGWRQALPAEAVGRIEALPQDFMEMFGYDASSVLPRHAEAFRRRPLNVMSTAQLSVPYLIETDFLGHNIVSYRQHFHAVPLTAGAVDLSELSEEELAKFVNGENLSSVRARIIAKEVERQVVPTVEHLVRSELKGLRNSNFDSGPLESDLACQSQASVQRISENAASAPPASPGDERVGQVHSLGSFLKYNLFRRRDCVIAVPMRLGPVDPNVYELRFNPGVIASSGLIATQIRILCAQIGWDY
ncbi:MAG: hypothetical protein JOZ83_06840 [Silvibacterium sp.]|nr:hypothetical protein [Silvibacterium sp.]